MLLSNFNTYSQTVKPCQAMTKCSNFPSLATSRLLSANHTSAKFVNSVGNFNEKFEDDPFIVYQGERDHDKLASVSKRRSKRLRIADTEIVCQEGGREATKRRRKRWRKGGPFLKRRQSFCIIHFGTEKSLEKFADALFRFKSGKLSSVVNCLSQGVYNGACQ